ncbi:hypothetical protein N7468_005286 [Penicillium chermesinum]|uniref:histidine kinase n=1 Tax=Penicillium chermesinum TaxID=63820 RepID=A0A9W9TMV1_9EURO|nr:uncharacterized protein N7468_005286 [Penicillium chermesinum]KAJ5232330.1 hypothetical protein N7468_005286 [Penicillium chermesinum]
MTKSTDSDAPALHQRTTGPFSTCKSESISSSTPPGAWNDGAQSTAIEQLVGLKQGLRTSDTELFWQRLMEDVTSISKAQYGFVARRVHGAESVKEVGDRRPSLFGAVFYYNDGYGNVGLQRDRYFAGGNPLLYMDYDRPCVISENLQSVLSFGDGQLPFPAEAYMAIPLFSNGKCLAHLGLMWSPEGAGQRDLSWSFLEMLLHSLEDMIVQRLLLDKVFPEHQLTEPLASNHPTPPKPVEPSQDVPDFTSQPLKPFARSLSHELRTPMQGVVGMLDVMHATVREAMESKAPVKPGGIFQTLKEGIEMVQDSARRAVEAADNVVHAYDLNMQVPKTPQREEENCDLSQIAEHPTENRPSVFIEGNNIAVNPYKRRRSLPLDVSASARPARRQRLRAATSRQELSPRSEEVKNAVHESDKIVHATPARQIEAVMANMVDPRPSIAVRRSAPHLLLEGINTNLRGPALRFTKLRDLLRLVINESLHVGGRPESAESNVTDCGETIEIRSRSSNGQVYTKTVDWSVDPALPETLLADDRDLAKLISYAKKNDVLIMVRDTGPGIPAAFLPNLFKPFAREDASITRSKDGLGLGLLVAKGLSRKMGGDLICVRSATTGPDHGSEFQIRVPVNQREAYSRLRSPCERTMTPPSLNGHTRTGSGSSFVWEPASLSSPAVSQNIQLQQPTPSTVGETPSHNSPSQIATQPQITTLPISQDAYDKKLGEKYPLRFLVAEDNRINRRVLVNMLRKLGYRDVLEAADGREAVQIVKDTLTASTPRHSSTAFPSLVCGSPDEPPETHPGEIRPIDIVLMDLWMPEMDGYEATTRILQMVDDYGKPSTSLEGSPRIDSINSDSMEMDMTPRTPQPPTILAVSADVTDEALARASKVGIKGYMTKPYKLTDLERLILGFCGDRGDMIIDS